VATAWALVEVAEAMRLTGASSLDQVTRDLLWTAPALTTIGFPDVLKEK